jgi:TPR repeat protein
LGRNASVISREINRNGRRINYGNVKAQRRLGFMYKLWKGVWRDSQKAFISLKMRRRKEMKMQKRN